MQFRIDKCDGKVNECESDEKIKGFLRDIKFQTWIVQEHIDFRKISEEPVSKQMLVVDQSNVPVRMLRDDDYTVFVATALMQKNTYNTYDSWFSVGQMTYDNAFYTVATKNSI